MPVMCVVRISAPESFVIVAFCSPMMKHSSVTVTGTKKVSLREVAAEQPEQQQQRGLDQQRQHELAAGRDGGPS